LQPARTVAVVGTFTALAIASDLAMSGIPNVKVVDALVFASAFLFGFRVGAYVGVLSELIWGTMNPLGFGGYIIPFLVLGEVMYAAAGWGASKLWGGRTRLISDKSIFLGATLAICAFLWDVETNIGTALIGFWPSVSLGNVLATMVLGAPFMLAHELADLFMGAVLAPLIIQYLPRLAAARRLSLASRE
jgi:hypothetical protein